MKYVGRPESFLTRSLDLRNIQSNRLTKKSNRFLTFSSEFTDLISISPAATEGRKRTGKVSIQDISTSAIE